ncbi:MAG: hypothetical protein EXR49_01565 [Dehalococcoidia bacterium]|nr:hypothetical protein [Dehalococcoidia bacterium]
MTVPWTEGPKELLQHAADHLRLGGDFDRRIAMISVDNAVELAAKTFLGLPERARGSKGPGRKSLDDASESFPALLDMLNQYAANKLVGVELEDIEWYHRLRNQLYHSGNGLTVDRAKVEAYFKIASALFENLFDTPLEINEANAVYTKTGEFLGIWNSFEQGLRTKLPPKEGLAYYWKREYMETVSQETAELWDGLRHSRNNLLHGLETPVTPEIDRRIDDLQRLMRLLGIATS